MSKTRWLISILLLLVVPSVILFSLFYYRSDRSERGLELTVEDPPAHVITPVVVVRGRVSKTARIEVSRDTSALAAIVSEDKFEVEVQLEPGQNQIRVAARPVGEDELLSVDSTFFVTWEPKNPPIPTINALPTTINVPALTITGSAYPSAVVELLVSPESTEILPSSYFPTATNDGTFATKLRLPAPGTYKVSAATRNSLGVKSAASPELKIVYDPEWYPPSNPGETQQARRVIRKADLVIRHKQLTMTYEVTLPKDDPAVTTLLANKSSLAVFFHEIFGLTTNNFFHPGDFENVVPEVVFKDQDATIKASSWSHRAVRDYLPVLRGEIKLGSSRGFPFSKPDDRLSITTYDYTVESEGPPPALVDRNTLIWTGSGKKAPTGDALVDVMWFYPNTSEIKLKLAYQPFASPRNFLRLARVSPYNLWQYPGNTIPQLILGLLRLIPMLWVLWLVADWQLKNAIDSGLRNDLYKLSGTLITLSLVEPILNTSRGLAYLGRNYDIQEQLSLIGLTEFIGLTEYRPVLPILAALGVFLLAVLVELFAWTVSRRPWAIWTGRVGRGVRNAALICILLELTRVLYLNLALTRLPNMLIMAVTLGYLFFRMRRVLRHAAPSPKHNRRLIVLTLIILLIFMIPSAFTASGTEAQWHISQLFSMLDSLLPYALAIGLMIVLKNIDMLDQRRHRHVVLTIGLILFSGFLVGPTSNLFMIPIPFIISIWMYRHFLVHDFSKCGDLDDVNNEVVSDRRRLIDGVLTHETAQHFQAHIEKLKDKVTSGDMTVKEFEDRKREIEQYANDKALASTHVNGLHAKTTVLSIGPNAEDWKNGRWCLRWGAVLITPFFGAFLLLRLLRPTAFSESVFGFMFGFNQLLTFVADWLLAAFFFGYFFRYIRGNSGLEKGLRTACAIIICLLPTWLSGISDNSDVIGVLFGAGQTFLFFTLLGMGAFDYATFRNALRDQFRWRTFARFGNMPSFTAVVSVLLTTLGVGLTSVVTGRFTDLLTNLLNAVFQQAPGPPST